MIDKLDIHALVDNELSPDQKSALMDELAKDPKAMAEYRSILGMKEALRTRLDQPESEHAWKACRSRLDELDKTRRVESFVGRYAWGICGAFTLLILVAGVWNRKTSGVMQTNEVSSMMLGLSPVSVPKSQRQSELEPRLKQVVGNAFSNRPSRMVITAVGENNTPGQRTSYVQLSDDFGAVSVFALFDVREVTGTVPYDQDPMVKCGKIDGLNALLWTRDDGVLCMVVGQRGYEELYSIVQAMCPNRG